MTDQPRTQTLVGMPILGKAFHNYYHPTTTAASTTTAPSPTERRQQKPTRATRESHQHSISTTSPYRMAAAVVDMCDVCTNRGGDIDVLPVKVPTVCGLASLLLRDLSRHQSRTSYNLFVPADYGFGESSSLFLFSARLRLCWFLHLLHYCPREVFVMSTFSRNQTALLDACQCQLYCFLRYCSQKAFTSFTF